MLDKFYSKIYKSWDWTKSISLCKVSSFLEADNVIEIKNIVIDRINNELRFAFCDDGGCKENSPSCLYYGIPRALGVLEVGYKYKKENDILWSKH